MPLATLRPQSSLRNIQNGDVPGTPTEHDGPRFSDVEGADGPRTQSLRAYGSGSLWKPDDNDSPPPSVRPLTSSGRPQPQRRFSLKRFRHASDPQLSARFTQAKSASGSSTPPGAPAPIIGITAPTWDMNSISEKPKRRFNLFTPKQQSFKSKSSQLTPSSRTQSPAPATNRGPFKSRKSNVGNDSLEQSRSPSASTNGFVHNLHSDTAQSLSVPPSRVSASSLSEQGDDVAHARPAAIRSASSTSSSFFRLPRRKKKKEQESLFPLPVKLSPSNPTGPEPTPETSTIKPVQRSSAQTSRSNPSPASSTPYPPTHRSAGSANTPPLSRPSADLLSVQPFASTFPLGTSPLTRHDSTTSAPVTRSTPVANPVLDRHFRGRSGTSTSFNSRADDERAPTPFHESVGRNSMASTTLGRNSVAGLRSLTSRWRGASESQSPGVHSPGGLPSSKNNSFALSKETLVVPEREEGETAGKFYSRLENDMPKKSIALSLSKSADPFHHDVLRSLMRTFKFYEEPLDIALRKFLFEIDLPGEAQQIDRVISSFAERYHECNPHIFIGFDQVFVAAYSLIILHSDLFNKNNKKKMQRAEYQKNTGGHGIDDEILGYFYDNIHYTEFVAQTPDDDESERKSRKSKARKKVKKIKVATAEGVERGKLDPYDFILDDKLKLESLRPALKGAMNLEDTFNYLGNASLIDIRKIRSAFIRPCILQIISARSRPEAFSSPSTIDNPLEAQAGVVDVKVAKVGIIWRKDPRKKKTRSPWQKWGTMLTQSQLYFFRNVAWIEDLMKQSEPQQRRGYRQSVVVFRPQIEELKPDFQLRTAGILALVDTTYDKHKNGFVLASYDGFSDETVLADSEHELHDWLSKINYCAAFASANIAMYPAQASAKDSLLRAETGNSSHSAPSVTASDDASEYPIARQINAARKEAISSRVETTETSLRQYQEALEEHLKTARHLQILAPFPPKTRNDLLAFGAKMAHRVRWSRFDVWRLKCHRDMLMADLDFEDRPRDSAKAAEGSPKLKPVSPRVASKANALSRLNSKASAIIYPQKSSKLASAQARMSASSRLSAAPETDLATGIDQAFATPADTVSRFGSASESPFKLPPLAMGSGAISVNSYDTDQAESVATDNAARHSSIVSDGSAVVASEKATTPSPSVHGQDDKASAEKRPSTAVESDREQATGSSAAGRSQVRRSLQRTLRDSREFGGHQRSRRQKDSASTIVPDDTGAREENETLPRGTGSFKVHGKKASVITLGSEWQGMSAEERLRARKQAQSQDAGSGVSPVAEREGEVGDVGDDVGDAEGREPNSSAEEEGDETIEAVPIADSDGEIVAYTHASAKKENADDDDESQLSTDIPLERSATDLGDEPGPALEGGSSSLAASSDEVSSNTDTDDKHE